MARVDLFEGGNIAPAQATNARLQAADYGPGIGRGVEELGQGLGEAATAVNQIGQIHDEASVKEVTNSLVNEYIQSAYTSDNAFFKQQGRAAMDAAPLFDQDISERVKAARSGLQNERQRSLFDDALTPQMQSWALQRGTYVNKETLQYGADQSKARSETSVNAGLSMFPTNPQEGEKQLGTALGEVANRGKLQGWSDAQIAAEQEDTQSKFYSTLATSLAVNDPVEAWNFVDAYKDEIGPQRIAEIQTTLRPRVMRQQGLELADRISGVSQPKAPDGSTVDPLAPIPEGQAHPRLDPHAFFAEFVSPHEGGYAAHDANGAPVNFGINQAANPGLDVKSMTKAQAADIFVNKYFKAAGADKLPAGLAAVHADTAFINPAAAQRFLAQSDGDPQKYMDLREAWMRGMVQRNPTKFGKFEKAWSNRNTDLRAYAQRAGGGNYDPSAVSPEMTLGTQLKTLDSMDAPFEVKQAAREALTQRAQANSMVAKEEHQSWLNSFEVSLHDGSAGLTDIHAARRTGKLTDYDEITRAENIVNDRNKGAEDLTNFGKMMGDPHFVFNQFDDSQKKAVEAGVKSMGATPEAAFQIWQRTGILAKAGSVAIRGALVSIDPTAVRRAANVAGNMLHRNPNAFAGVDGQADIEHAATSFNHYVFDLGLAPAAAAQRVAQENDPKFKEQVKYTDPMRQDAMKQLRQSGGAQAQMVFGNATFPNPEQRGEANQTYQEMIVDQLARGLDLGSAQVQAKAQLLKVYGVNKEGHIVKYAPEAAYPPVGGSYDYIYDDAGRTVKQETGRTPVSVNLVPIPGVTDEDFRTGRPARYRLLYSYVQNGQKIVDVVPGEFAADVSVSAKALSTQRRRSFAQERRQSIELRRGADARLTDPAMQSGAMH